MRSNRAFTLAELLIGVTVSAIIMTGVAVFVGSGIENSYRIRKGLEENRSSGNFDAALGDVASFWGNLLFSWSFAAPYGTGFVLFNADRNVPISIIAAKTVTGVCDAYSGTTDQSWTGTILEVVETYRIDGVRNEPWFAVDHTWHVIRNSGGTAVLGTGNPWSAGGNGEAGTSTELRFPTAIVSAGGWKYLVADSGNDRVLVFDGSSASELVWPSSWIRQPYDLSVNGGSVGILENWRTSTIVGSPNVNGGSFSGTFRAETPFSFDSVRVTLGWGRIPPSGFASYAFDFTPASGTASVVGNTALVSFSGASYSYAAWQTGSLSINSISVTAAPNGWHLANAEYFLAGTLKYRRDFSYFVSDDGNPLTPNDNAFVVTKTPKGVLPTNPSVSWANLTYSNYANYPQAPNTAAATKRTTSSRLVDSVRLETNGNSATLSYFEYVRFDCLHGNHVKRERLVRIPLN